MANAFVLAFKLFYQFIYHTEHKYFGEEVRFVNVSCF